METTVKQQIIEQFNEFLRKNNAAAKFHVNCQLDKCNLHSCGFKRCQFKTLKESVNVFLNRTDPEEFITAAFLFDKTKEKFRYWRILSIEWETIVDILFEKELKN